MALSKILSLILSCTMLIGTQAVFAPLTRHALRTAASACCSETPDGSCPNFAISNDATGNPYGAIGDWDVSAVTEMFSVFSSKSDFNQDLSKWNTGAVTRMESMFSYATAFNGDVSTWNTGAVTNMYRMFANAYAFNGDVSTWNTGAVTNMNSMFNKAYSFNKDVSNWNTGAVTDMGYMFYCSFTTVDGVLLGPCDFNQDVSNWNTAAVTQMIGMFGYTAVFNQDLSKWDTGAVTNMNSMFQSAQAFNTDLNTWDLGAVTTMNSMFEVNTYYRDNYGVNVGYTRVLCGPKWALQTESWHILKKCCDSGTYMTNPHKPFNQATSCAVCPSTGCTPEMLHGTANPFVATDQATLRAAVGGCLGETSDGSCPIYAKQNGAIGDWDVSAVTTMVGAYPYGGIFQGATQFNQDLSKWDVSKLTDMSSMFSGAAAFNQDLSNWDTGAVKSMLKVFEWATAFNQDLSNWNTGAVTSMSYMFNGAVAFNQDLSNWNTFAVTDMSYMFTSAGSFNSDIFRHTGGVIFMNHMFSGAVAFNQDLSKWDTGTVLRMGNMFHGATQFNQDLSKWNVGVVTQMVSIFLDSGMTQTLCGTAAHGGNAIPALGWGKAGLTSEMLTARLGCCPPGTFMAQPNLSPFSVATACEACPIGQWGSAVPDDLTSCNKVTYCKHVSLGVTDCTETDDQSCSLSDGLAGCDDLQLAKIKAHYHNHSLASCTY